MFDEIEEVMKELEMLERYFDNDYISLRTYYEIKDSILLKYIAIGESYRSEVREKLENG